MAFQALQYQANASKNQLVLGQNGQKAVISAEQFGQVSTVKIPDPGTATADFVLTSVASGSQTINGNLTVTGTVTSSGGSSSGDFDLTGDLVFSNAADRCDYGSMRTRQRQAQNSVSWATLAPEQLVAPSP
jgi:phage baseplate assembly protein gpV